MIPNYFIAYLVTTALSLAVFTLYRVIFFIRYHAMFGPYSAGDILLAFLQGLRFDLNVVSFAVGFSYLFIHLPVEFRYKKQASVFFHWLPFPLMVAFSMILTADIYYYEEAGRRLSYEIFTLGNDISETAAMAAQYRSGWLLFTVVCVLLFWPWMAIGRWQQSSWEKATLVKRVLAFTVFIMIFGFSLRGSIDRAPIRLSHAFKMGSTELGHLMLNPVFTVAKSYTAGNLTAVNHFPEDEARKTVRGLLKTDELNLLNSEFPIFRANQYPAGRPFMPNIVIMVLESWSSTHMGAQGADLQATPNFDRLIREGLFFDDCYAVGVRTTEGLAAIMLGLPALNHTGEKIVGSILSGSLEQNNYRGLASILSEQGYKSLFIQGGRADSFRMYSLARMAGFEEYLSIEDFDLKKEDLDSAWGAWDHVMLDRLDRTLGKKSEPFLALWLSTSNHPPYGLPPGFAGRMDPGLKNSDFLNSITYTDESLGTFFSTIAREPYFQRTIFVLTADHASRSLSSLKDRFHIPLLIYGPGMITPGVSDKTVSQVDILPTILDLAGVRGQHHAFGVSLLEEDPRGFAPINLAQGYGWVQDGRFLSIDPDGSLVSIYDYRKGRYLDKQEVDLRGPLSYFQVANNLLASNRLAPRH